MPTANDAPALISKAPASPWKIAYRIIKWITLAGAVLSLLLILHKVSPPDVAGDPRAAERLEAKLHDAEMATASGQPYLLKITEAELNSFLGTHLELKPTGTPSQTPATAPAPTQSPAAPGSAETNATVEEVQSSVRDVRINLVEN